MTPGPRHPPFPRPELPFPIQLFLDVILSVAEFVIFIFTWIWTGVDWIIDTLRPVFAVILSVATSFFEEYVVAIIDSPLALLLLAVLVFAEIALRRNV